MLYRIDTFSDKPKAIEALSSLSQAISETQMQKMNAAVEMGGSLLLMLLPHFLPATTQNSKRRHFLSSFLVRIFCDSLMSTRFWYLCHC